MITSTMAHTAKTVFFTCIDDRLGPAHAAFVAARPGGSFHPQLAGGALAFLDSVDRPAALKQIMAPFRIQPGITDVYLESHTDCGAYRLAGATFNDPAAELTRLYADLDRAAELIRHDLAAAGIDPSHVAIHTQVVDPAGHALDKPAK